VDEIEQRVRADIERYGWHVAKIAGEDSAPPWAFTIGLWDRFEQPELVIFGLDLDAMHELLNEMGQRVIRGARFEANLDYTGILEQHAIAVRPIQQRWFGPLLGNAGWFYRERPFEAVQCFWPGPNGRHPWDAAFDPEWDGRQPLLYLEEESRALPPALAQALREEGDL
jgi:hypothetical protein